MPYCSRMNVNLPSYGTCWAHSRLSAGLAPPAAPPLARRPGSLPASQPAATIDQRENAARPQQY